LAVDLLGLVDSFRGQEIEDPENSEFHHRNFILHEPFPFPSSFFPDGSHPQTH